MNPLPDDVLHCFLNQSKVCHAMDSPFTGALCAALPDAVNGVVRDRLANWAGDPYSDALALRLCGAMQALARSGDCPELEMHYPPRAAGWSGDLAAILPDVIREHGLVLSDWLNSAPQTNEVRRSAVLLGGLLALRSRHALPMALHEIGASAGLNLHLDAWRYDLGQTSYGPVDASVTIPSEWRGRLPDTAQALEIVSRHGADLSPLDPAKVDTRDRMMAYIWPDQAERRARTLAALDLAARSDVRVVHAEAAVWVEETLSRQSPEGQIRVLMHSIAWQYFPEETKARIRRFMAEEGGKAHADRPLAWLEMEDDGTPGSASVRLTVWPGGETRVLGRAHYHGAWADWDVIQI